MISDLYTIRCRANVVGCDRLPDQTYYFCLMFRWEIIDILLIYKPVSLFSAVLDRHIPVCSFSAVPDRHILRKAVSMTLK